MKMVKIKTADLIGAQLDWAVELANGAELVDDYGRPKLKRKGSCAVMDVLKNNGYITTPNYSTDWSNSGPIIERERIAVGSNHVQLDARRREGWCAQAEGRFCDGPTPLIAAMRAFVASKLGDEVEVPEVSS